MARVNWSFKVTWRVSSFSVGVRPKRMLFESLEPKDKSDVWGAVVSAAVGVAAAPETGASSSRLVMVSVPE